MRDFDLEPDPRGFFLDVQYPDEDKPRYTIDLLKMECTCIGFTMEQAKAKKENRKPKSCKHLQEVEFRLHHAGVRLGRLNLKESIV